MRWFKDDQTINWLYVFLQPDYRVCVNFFYYQYPNFLPTEEWKGQSGRLSLPGLPMDFLTCITGAAFMVLLAAAWNRKTSNPSHLLARQGRSSFKNQQGLQIPRPQFQPDQQIQLQEQDHLSSTYRSTRIPALTAASICIMSTMKKSVNYFEYIPEVKGFSKPTGEPIA